ncbi:hypothetical protein ACIQZB_44735 [Streptomyces sp. NPDC097727]|uniref:hypothetical protein n=1 Tax=Streptomyces sp. NPDC097727 TaxID=3366092 RepID=UPI0038087DD9
MDKRRVVAVQASIGGQPTRISSGYLIAPRLVLTAAHAVPQDARAAVQPLQSAELLPCASVWDGRERGLDALLLEVAPQHWPNRVTDSPVRFGRLVTSLPGTRATAIGFAVAGRTGGAIETTQVNGIVHPGDGLLSERWRLSLDGPIPVELGASPWRGMSGAALWAEHLLCGVITEDAANWAHRKLDAVPVHRLLRDEAFREVLRERTGRVPVVEPVELFELSESPVPHRLPQSPAELLRPQMEAVPFLGRESWLRVLRQWCQGDGVSIRLIVGPGGQGKTRLAREFAVQLAAKGWASCQFRDCGLGDAGAAQGLSALAAVDRPLLIVMDYADTRPALITEVLRVLEDRPVDVPVRVLLIARSSGEWWEHLPGAGPRSAGTLGGARILELRDAADGPAERYEFYRAALIALADRLKNLPGHAETDWSAAARSVDTRPEQFAGRGSGSALTLQMRALTDLLDVGTGARPCASGTGDAAVDVEGLLLDHEEGYWRRTAARHPALADLEPGPLADAVAIATLTRACGTGRAVELLAAVPSIAQLGDRVLRALASWLRDLYPDIDGSYWGALEPDRLGEYHVLRRARGGSEILAAVLPCLNEAEAERALTVLARAAALPVRLNPDLSAEAGELIRAHPGRLAVPAVAVAVRSENPGFLVGVISLVAQRADLPVDLMKRLHEAVPERSRLLGDEAVQLAQRLRTIRRGRALRLGGGRIGPVRARSGWADAEYHLAVRLCAVQCWEDALAASSRAVALYRALARRTPAEFLPRLVDALSFRSTALSELARGQDALVVATEAVAVGERLVEGGGKGVEQHRLRLALALNNQSVSLAAHGAMWEALKACEGAADLMRDLAKSRPARYDVVLGGVLHNLANRYAALFTADDEAAKASALAVQVRRRLALAQPDAHLGDLLDSLHNHAVSLFNLEEHVSALDALDECVGLALQMMEGSSPVHLAQMARTLLARSSVLGELDRHDEAVLCSTRAVLFYRALADRVPNRYEPELMKALGRNAILGLLADTDIERYEALQNVRARLRQRIQQRDLARELHRTRWQRRWEKAVLAARWLGSTLGQAHGRGRWQTRAMRCDVCDHEMAKWDVPPSRSCRELWTCTWCHAVTYVGTPEHEISRPWYSPWDLRWEAAWTDMLPDAHRHAYGYLHRTLCGIERPDMTGSQFGMWGDRSDECPDCMAAALAIDARWPQERREGFRVSIPAAPRSRPEDDLDYVQPADELGRPDVQLPQTPASPRTRVLAGHRPRTRRGRVPSDR